MATNMATNIPPLKQNILQYNSTGTLMSVNDTSGLAVLSVQDDGAVIFGGPGTGQSKIVMSDENGDEWYLKIENDSLSIEPKSKEKLREWKLKDLMDSDSTAEQIDSVDGTD